MSNFTFNFIFYSSISRFLRSQECNFTLEKNNLDFKMTAAVIKTKKKHAKSNGLGNFQYASDLLSPMDEGKLWTEDLMGIHSPIAILRALWFLTTKLMGMSSDSLFI